jgi:putative hydrolase of the HAD superfamily
MQQTHQPAIRAIGFDVDGTLYSNLRMYLSSLGWGVRNLRLSLALRDVREELRREAPVADFYAVQARRTAAVMGRQPEVMERLIRERIYSEWELSLRGLALSPGLIACLEDLRAAGIRLGVLSDFPVARKLELLGLDRYFDCAFCTEDSGCLKPHHEGFDRLAGALGADPAEILYVGNSYHFDVLGAKAAGMRSAHFARRPHEDSRADFTFRHYRQLGAWVLGGR